MAGYEVELKDDCSVHDFNVKFHAPKDTLYEGGVYKIHVVLPEQYPFVSPSIGFAQNSIFHPNIDWQSGSVCMDVIGQTWTPLYSLVNIFDVFLPQLLTYPNPSDPLNSDAASLWMSDRRKYEEKVRACVRQFASEDQASEKEHSRQSLASTKAPDDDATSEVSELSGASNESELDL